MTRIQRLWFQKWCVSCWMNMGWAGKKHGASRRVRSVTRTTRCWRKHWNAGHKVYSKLNCHVCSNWFKKLIVVTAWQSLANTGKILHGARRHCKMVKFTWRVWQQLVHTLLMVWHHCTVNCWRTRCCMISTRCGQKSSQTRRMVLRTVVTCMQRMSLCQLWLIRRLARVGVHYQRTLPSWTSSQRTRTSWQSCRM